MFLQFPRQRSLIRFTFVNFACNWLINLQLLDQSWLSRLSELAAEISVVRWISARENLWDRPQFECLYQQIMVMAAWCVKVQETKLFCKLELVASALKVGLKCFNAYKHLFENAEMCLDWFLAQHHKRNLWFERWLNCATNLFVYSVYIPKWTCGAILWWINNIQTKIR